MVTVTALVDGLEQKPAGVADTVKVCVSLPFSAVTNVVADLVGSIDRSRAVK